MTMIAYAFLQARRLKQAKGGEKNLRPAAATKPSYRAARNPSRPRATAASPMSTLPIPHDPVLYRQRHHIENMFGKLPLMGPEPKTAS
jgi:SRSO17 transposase